MSYTIVTDSSSDLPLKIREEFDLTVFPFTVTIDGVNIKDSEISPKEVMDKMRNGALTKTSQVTVGDFVEAFTHFAKLRKSIIYLAFSSGLSGTYYSSCLAADQVREEYPEFDISIVDTKCASTGFGLVVYKALCMQRDGATKEEVVKASILNSENMEHVFTVDSLEYLFRGGRVSRAAALIGGILGIKPILDVDEDGKLRPIEKVRGRKASVKRLAELAGVRGYDLDKQTIGICHGDDIEAANELANYMRTMYGSKEFIISEVGTTIGSHSGPGTLALFFLSK